MRSGSFLKGSSIGEIAHKLGLGRRRVERWARRIDLPNRNTMASTPSTPAYFGVLLERRRAGGITKVRHLFAEIRHRGYTGSFSHLARFLAPWRSGEPSLGVPSRRSGPPVPVRTQDPMTGRVISPLTAAALCVKPRGEMAALSDALSRSPSRWNGGGVGRLVEDPQASHAWPRRCRVAPRQDDAAVGGDLHQESIRRQLTANRHPFRENSIGLGATRIVASTLLVLRAAGCSTISKVVCGPA
jgi:hypothetical protein